jgi:hypothetical protein
MYIVFQDLLTQESIGKEDLRGIEVVSSGLHVHREEANTNRPTRSDFEI